MIKLFALFERLAGLDLFNGLLFFLLLLGQLFAISRTLACGGARFRHRGRIGVRVSLRGCGMSTRQGLITNLSGRDVM